MRARRNLELASCEWRIWPRDKRGQNRKTRKNPGVPVQKKCPPKKGVSLRVNKKPNGHKKWPAKELEGKCQRNRGHIRA